jgi:hypothetical protein
VPFCLFLSSYVAQSLGFVTSGPQRFHAVIRPTTFFPSKMAEIVRLCVNPVRSPAEFPGILHGQYCSRGTSRGSRLHPVKSRVHGVLHGVDVPAGRHPVKYPGYWLVSPVQVCPDQPAGRGFPQRGGERNEAGKRTRRVTKCPRG